jgi:hypothetical protein
MEMGAIVFADFALAEDFSLSSSSSAYLQALMTLVWVSGLIAFQLELLMYLVPTEAFFPLPLQLVVAKAIHWAGTGATSYFNGLYSFIRVRALWMSEGYASMSSFKNPLAKFFFFWLCNFWLLLFMNSTLGIPVQQHLWHSFAWMAVRLAVNPSWGKDMHSQVFHLKDIYSRPRPSLIGNRILHNVIPAKAHSIVL